MTDLVLERYLLDLGALLKEKGLAARAATATTREPLDYQYAQGRLMAFVEVLSLMQQQADAFGLDQASLSLSGFDPEQDLLSET